MSSSSPPESSKSESKSTDSNQGMTSEIPSSSSPPPSSDSSWSSWFVSPSTLRDQFLEFDDQQRLDRLSECRKLEKVLRGCRKRHQPGKPKSRYTKNNDGDDPIESISIGVRNMKYFGWRGILLSSPPSSVSAPKDDLDGANDNGTSSEGPTSEEPNNLSVFYPKIRSSCAREEHAVWACRAISTGCGKDLSELKKCFENVDIGEQTTGEDTSRLPQHVRVLTSPYTNYQGIVDKVSGDTLKQQIPCHEIQGKLGSCITESGRQLLERKQQREQQRKQ